MPDRALTSRTLTGWEDMERELIVTRRRGYAMSEGELEEGLSSCAVALPAHADRPYAINVIVAGVAHDTQAGARGLRPVADERGERDRRQISPQVCAFSVHREQPGAAMTTISASDPVARDFAASVAGVAQGLAAADPWRPGSSASDVVLALCSRVRNALGLDRVAVNAELLVVVLLRSSWAARWRR